MGLIVLVLVLVIVIDSSLRFLLLVPTLRVGTSPRPLRGPPGLGQGKTKTDYDYEDEDEDD